MSEDQKERIIKSLNGIVESYEVLLDVFKSNPIAISCINGAFMGEIKDAKKLIKELKGAH